MTKLGNQSPDESLPEDVSMKRMLMIGVLVRNKPVTESLAELERVIPSLQYEWRLRGRRTGSREEERLIDVECSSGRRTSLHVINIPC